MKFITLIILIIIAIIGSEARSRVVRNAEADAEANPQLGLHRPQYKRICKTENSVSDTKLCKPRIGKDCKPAQVKVKRPMKYPLRKCTKVSVPNCQTLEKIEVVKVCNHGLDISPNEVKATLVQQQNSKRCDISYETKCSEPSAFGEEPDCHSVPKESCYDVPTTVPIEMPVDVKKADVTKDCRDVEVKVPEVVCDDITEEICYDVPIVEDIESTNEICQPKVIQDDCEDVRLTIPYETCYYEQVPSRQSPPPFGHGYY